MCWVRAFLHATQGQHQVKRRCATFHLLMTLTFELIIKDNICVKFDQNTINILVSIFVQCNLDIWHATLNINRTIISSWTAYRPSLIKNRKNYPSANLTMHASRIDKNNDDDDINVCVLHVKSNCCRRGPQKSSVNNAIYCEIRPAVVLGERLIWR